MINYTSLENKLFNNWSENHDIFIKDGVVNETIYNEQNFKIAYVLKEVNDTSACGSWDLRNFISSHAHKRTPTWNNIIAWTYGINTLIESYIIPNWPEVEMLLNDEEKKIELLNQICAFNLKKSPGGTSTLNKSISDYVAQNNRFIKQQYQIYAETNLFICCGSPVGDLMKEYVFDSFNNWERTNRGIWFKKLVNNKFAIYYHHPNARVDATILFYGLIDAIKYIYQK